MSSDAPFTAIRTYLTANWSATTLAWPNEPFTRPTSAPFVAVEVIGKTLEQIEIGNPGGNGWRESGTLWMHVYAPADSGSLTVRQHAKALATLFRNRMIDFVVFQNGSIGPAEPGHDLDGWWRVSVAVTWSYEDH